jgi:phage shock protein C
MKKLYRSNKDKVIAGVCGGLGEYFAVDARIFRVLFVLAMLVPVVPGIIPYIIMWILIPQHPIKSGQKSQESGNIVDVEVA